MAKRARKTKFSDEIRQAIIDAPVSRYAVSKATGIDQSTVSRFMSGAGGLSVDALDKLAAYLGWHLKVDDFTTEEGE